MTGENEESCEASNPTVAIEPVVNKVVVPIPVRTVAVEIPHVTVAVRVAKMRALPPTPPSFE